MPDAPMPERSAALGAGAVPLGYDPAAAARHLVAVEPRLVPIVEAVGPPSYVPRGGTPFDALLRAICYQQLNGKAAATIHRRVLAALGTPEGGASDPAALLNQPEEALRACGLSRAKTAAVHDLARKTMEGTVPSLDDLHALDDEAVIRRLVLVRGVGPWTVEMLLLFTRGRLRRAPCLRPAVGRARSHAQAASRARRGVSPVPFGGGVVRLAAA